jgi:hypothetical protein
VTDLDGFDHEDLDPEQLRRRIANLELRKCERIDCHKKRAGRLAGLRFLQPSEHGKHFMAGADKLDLQKRSRGPISYFYTDYRSADLRATFWSWFFMFFVPVASLEVYEEMLTPGTEENVSYCGQFWHRFLDPQPPAGPLRVCFHCLGPVGASSGKETSHICYDIDLSTRSAHAFPESPIFGIDDLNC